MDPSHLVGRGDSPTLGSLRRSRGLTLAELAHQIHASRSTVSRWESGQVSPALPPVTLELLASALGVSSTVVREALVRGRG